MYTNDSGTNRRSRLSVVLRKWVLPALAVCSTSAWSSYGQQITRGIFAEPLINDGETVGGNDLLLDAVVKSISADRGAKRIDLEPLRAFMRRNPDSGWRVSVWTNLGIESYQQGSFSTCLECWSKAWEAGKDSANPKVRALADRSFAEWMKMLSRLGHVPELRAGLASVKGRNFEGMVAEMVQVARDSLWVMENKPEVSFRCGPNALQRILTHTNAPNPWPAEIIASASPPGGIPLPDVAALSVKVGMNYQMAKRVDPEAEFPVPAVIHWKLEHYGAVVKQEGNRYLLDDPTFGNGLIWIEEDILRKESSGYCLLPPGPLPPGWESVDAAEGTRVIGRGYPSGDQPGCTGPGNPKSPDDDSETECKGMARWSVSLMMCSLGVSDTPLGYSPPAGPPINFSVHYNQRETNQPAVLDYANFGPLWNCDWIGSLTFDSTTAYFNRGQGGIETFTGFDSATQSYAPGYLLSNRLVKVSATNYELHKPDGGKIVFAMPNHPTTPTRIFMTQVVDPYGNAVTLAYDGTFRLTSVTDAIGQTSIFTYGTGGETLLVKKITDPFGRFASFDYNPSGRLIKITDVIGLTSEFTYDAQNKLLTLTTGYGVTTFAYGTVNANRSVEITHPNGDKERFEQRNGSTPGVLFSEPAAVIPQGFSVFNEYLDGRNTFHWDRKAFKGAPGNYTKARLYHFLHQQLATRSPIMESFQMPGERRVWLTYQGQSTAGFYNAGMVASAPSRVGRVLDDGATQLYRFGYNPQGQVTEAVDPLGRTVRAIYAANGADLLEVNRIAENFNTERLELKTWNAQHRPLTIADAAGQTTTFTYNARGQVQTITNAKNQVTTCHYNAKGYLTSIDGPLVGTADLTTFTYDAYGRVETVTDSEGYMLAYQYDLLNRPTRITYPDATYQEVTYALLNVDTVRDRRGRITDHDYDSLGKLVKSTDPLARITRYAWCRCGALKSIIDALGRETRWEFDLGGRKTAKIYADGSRITYEYENTTSRLRSVSDEKGQIKTYDYFIDDQLSAVTYHDTQNPTPPVSWKYDPWRGRQLSRADGAGLTRFFYHPITGASNLGAGMLARIDGPLVNDDITYTYDELGRILSRTIGGVAQTTSYDSLGRVSTVSNPLGAFTYGYVNASNRPSSVAYPNGQSTLFDYYPNSGDLRLKQIWHKLPGGATLAKYDYTYDTEGQILTWSQQVNANPARVWTFGYDLADQLASAAATNPTKSFSYSMDAAGNRLTETIDGVTKVANFNSLNQLVNLTNDTSPNRSYEWDAEDRLVAVVVGSHRSEFSYDALHRRVRTIEKTGDLVTSDKRFVWSGMELCEERNAAGESAVKRFLPQGVVAAGSPAFYARDHLGSVRAVTNGAGVVGARFDFDPYGRRTKVEGGLDVDLAFTGHYFQPSLGLHFAPLRVYHADHANWLNRDRLEERGGINLYAYVANNPIVFKDPLGTQGSLPEIELQPVVLPERGGYSPALSFSDLPIGTRVRVVGGEVIFERPGRKFDETTIYEEINPGGSMYDERGNLIPFKDRFRIKCKFRTPHNVP